MTVSPELDARFRDAAAAEGLLDVAYDLIDTPVGRLFVAVTGQGLCEISYDSDPEREESIKSGTEKLVELLNSNTELTQQDKELTEKVAALTREIHAQVVKTT